ncbi:serine hydrolase [Sphingorhabdus sp.]|jgi:CubicO group peptidase (beta-lactamase class C family)|uniref:serine hydrolase domain-containing protein n=1 Tax=Sphingorhabdus sp. TaxID=1902408 RepID=UPI0037C5CA11
MKKWIVGLLLVIAAAGGIGWFSMDKDMRSLAANLPTDRNVLFWSIAQRDAAFRAMDRLPVLAKANIIDAGDSVYPLPKGAPLSIDVDAYMKAQRTAGLVIVQDGKIRLEKYGLDFDGNGKWTSFSVAKSFTSTLVGAAIKDGYIKSLDDKVTVYIPEMKGSAYDDVTVAQLLTMTSGIKWNEDYEDPKSDVARFNEHKPEPGIDTTVSYMRKLPREAPAGSKWVYKTGETNLIGVLVSKATGKTLSAYLTEKVWTAFGMEQDASWLLGSTGAEISGCCLQASTRDYARFGQFILGGGVAAGKAVLPDGWIARATTKQADIGNPGRGYGFQWWTYDDGSYAAQGIFGQGIFIDPKRRLVIASNSNWPRASDPIAGPAREAFYKKVQAAIDAETAKGSK